MATIYVHFPWCLAKCPYCDFVSYATDPDAIEHAAYADAVLRETTARARALSAFGADPVITSVFFGGGTPSLWDAGELGRVLAGIHERFRTAPDVEVTVECNPTSLDAARARALVACGVNRLSVGTQSLRADQLRFLGRLHDADGARRAIEAALGSGARVSTDLIFGMPGQSPEDARSQAEALAGTGVGHLSCYQLTIEPGTQFGERKKRGLLPLANDADVADAFLAIDETLVGRGFSHYEISNYARPDQEARHNVSYWRGAEYIGLGAAAFGFVRTERGGLRYRNALEPSRYVAGTRAVRDDAVGEGDGLTVFTEVLDGAALLRERIMLGLRLASGFDIEAAGRELGVDVWTEERTRAVATLVTRGRLERSGGALRVPRAARLFTDDIAARLF